jgi:hypothetical protein
MFNTPFIIPVVAIICWAIIKMYKIKHGVSDASSDWDNKNLHTPPMFNKMMGKAMAERDAEVQSLKERVIVLEKIITDTHKSHSLSEEIERLREQQS